jgi:hypothetical protein
MIYYLAGGILPALNLAISWCFFIISQSIGNLWNLDFIGIPRDYTLEFTYYSFYLYPFTLSIKAQVAASQEDNHNSNQKQATPIGVAMFSSYLAGLIEGDGTIIVPKTERSPSGRLNYPSIQIVFHLKDLPLALLIQKTLGFGSICRKKGANAYTYTINNYDGIVFTVNLINGLMRTPKIHSLLNLIDYLNAKGENITKLPLDTSDINSNSWLTGFIEADGHFSVRATLSGKYPRTERQFCSEQRQIRSSWI